MTEEEQEEHDRNILKDLFTLNDFLECDATRLRLENEHLLTFEQTCEPNIEAFYGRLRGNMQSKYATPFAYDVNNDFNCILTTMVYGHINKKYDLNVFYDCPILAKPLVDQIDYILEKRFEVNKKKKNNIKLTSVKKYNWATKTYCADKEHK